MPLTLFRAFSAGDLQLLVPGPMAQGGVPSRASRLGCETVTFRAFGAGLRVLTHGSDGVAHRI
jgi:hypothetical protein